MKKILAASLLLVMVASAGADVSVPDFAFTGNELTTYTYTPTFSEVDIRYQANSTFDIYQNSDQFKGFEAEETKGYTSEDPGFFFSGKLGTAIGSLFIGERAYRNYIVKQFREKRHQDVIEGYDTYSPDIKHPLYADEVRMLYASSLVSTGQNEKGMAVLDELARVPGEFQDIVIDNYVSLLKQSGKQDAIRSFVPALLRPTIYAFTALLDAEREAGNWDKIVRYSIRFESIMKAYPQLYAYVMTAYYKLNDMPGVASLAQYVSDSTRAMLADAQLFVRQMPEARATIDAMPAGDSRYYLSAKWHVVQGDLTKAGADAEKIRSDRELLGLLMFYAGKVIPDIDVPFVTRFPFTGQANKEYVFHFSGLAYLSRKDHKKAAEELDKVTANETLLNEGYFYRGMAYFPLNEDIAAEHFVRFLNTATGERATIARFMLAQTSFKQGKFDDALMLVDDCTAGYCTKLKAQIAVVNEEYEKALDLAQGLQGDDISYIRAASFFNLSRFESAGRELEMMKVRDAEADLLLMKTYFKLNRLADASVLFEKRKGDAKLFAEGVRLFFLANQYEQALGYLNSRPVLEPEFQLMKAKILVSLKRYDEAMLLFRDLVKKRYSLYESIDGLVSVFRLKGEYRQAVEEAIAIVQDTPEFERKDLLIIDLARTERDGGDISRAIRLMNLFFEQFVRSPFLREAYMLRAQLFQAAGMFTACIRDTNRMLSRPDGDMSEVQFLKAECTEHVELPQALDMYRSMAKGDGRFVHPATRKLMLLSPDTAEVDAATEKLRTVDISIYYEGVVRFLSMQQPENLPGYQDRIRLLAATAVPEFASAGHYYAGTMQRTGGDGFEASRSFLRSFYLYPETPYGKKSVQAVIGQFDAAGRNAEANALRKRIGVAPVVIAPPVADPSKKPATSTKPAPKKKEPAAKKSTKEKKAPTKSKTATKSKTTKKK